jgi:DNA (cytosine-5)-methyltransferase 1
MNYASVCDGIGAAHVAWKPLGWQCSWTSEIEPFPAAVVDHHFGFANVGDMTKITEEMLHEHGPVELLVGGTPCQSFSVAGLRGGLADPRGNLALRFVQLASVMQPKWIVWENVPGVLSSGKGRDFGTFLGALGEIGYGFAYRVLDAQWFGVAQRRRRVFVVGYLGDWRRAAAVLFERESVFGNPPTRGAKGQGITSSPEGIAGNVSSKWAKGTGGPAGDECYNLVAFAQNQREEVRELGDCATALNLQGTHQQTFLATPYTKSKRAQSTTDDESWVPGEVSPTMSCFDQGDTRATTVVAFKPGQSEAAGGTFVTEEFAPTLQSQSNGSTAVPAVGFTYSGYSNQPAWMTGDRTDCLPASGHSDGSHQGVGVMSVRTAQTSANGHGVAVDVAHTLDRAQGQAVAAMAVRRLTPRECERLQGFPDDYTLVEYRKKPAADGPRYRALGNSMAVPVMRWIGERIKMVDELRSSP